MEKKYAEQALAANAFDTLPLLVKLLSNKYKVFYSPSPLTKKDLLHVSVMSKDSVVDVFFDTKKYLVYGHNKCLDVPITGTASTDAAKIIAAISQILG